MIKFSLLPVERREDIAVKSTLHDDLVTGDHIVVIGVHRLTVLFHDIVRDIDDIVDRTDPVRCEASLHPFGGRTDFYIFYNARGKTRAEIGVNDIDADIVGSFLVIAGLFDLRLMEFLSECRCRLTGDPDHAVAVHAVRCDLILDDRVVQA